jgi:hypothetical protein
MRERRLVLAGLCAAVGVFALAASTASGSVLIARGASNVKLKVVKGGKAVVSYKRGGRRQYLLAWGALNARAHPKCGKLHGKACGPAQVNLRHRRLHRSGHKAGKLIFAKNKCGPYDGPELGWLVAACRAPNGSYWALQRWARIARRHAAIGSRTGELRLSHWSGPLEKVVVKQTWNKAHGHYGERLYGQVTYRGKPVYGLRWNGIGVPLDGYGRVIYFDTFNSSYGSGWHRMVGFLSKPVHGEFCFNIAGPHVAGAGEQYRATAMGVGVTPDILVAPFAAKPASLFDWTAYVQSFIEQTKLAKGSKFCHPQKPR